MIDTYWTHEILAIEDKGPRSLVTGFSDCLAEALQSAFKDATYYIVACGYHVAVGFQQRCATCNGQGQVAKKRSKFLTMTCKACKGQPVVTDVAPRVWTPYAPIKEAV